MKNFLFVITAILFACVSKPSSADEFFKEVDFPISGAFIPQGFDNNDSIQFVVYGTFPNSCYQVGMVDTEYDFDTRRILVNLRAYQYTGDCSTFPAPFHKTVYVGLLNKMGTYVVEDKKSGTFLGGLKIDKAAAVGAGTDERTYAPLLDAFITTNNGQKSLTLRGTLPLSCLKIQKPEVLPQKNVVVILPTVTKNEEAVCTPGEFAYEQSFPIAEAFPRGKFLLHVRSMGGQAINKIMNP